MHVYTSLFVSHSFPKRFYEKPSVIRHDYLETSNGSVWIISRGYEATKLFPANKRFSSTSRRSCRDGRLPGRRLDVPPQTHACTLAHPRKPSDTTTYSPQAGNPVVSPAQSHPFTAQSGREAAALPQSGLSNSCYFGTHAYGATAM